MNYQPRYISQTAESPECMDMLSYTFSRTTELESVDKCHKSNSYAYFRLFSQYLACKYSRHMPHAHLSYNLCILQVFIAHQLLRERQPYEPLPTVKNRGSKGFRRSTKIWKRKNGLCDWSEQATLPHKTSKADY